MPATLGTRGPDVNGAAPTGPINPNDDLVHYFHVAALVTVVYDHFLTLDGEVEYIWSKKWSKSKILFILARYFGDLLLISVCVVFLNRQASYLFCDIGLKFVGTGSMVIIIITQLIMQFRIEALYGKVISTLITVFWVMEVIAVLGLGIASLAAIDGQCLDFYLATWPYIKNKFHSIRVPFLGAGDCV
ncbi:hypothetical protein CPB84DRAFT_1777276 [Gymnopilus junonius]|uniref:DUF6533 domain-containing protein n=1 Tax=Gymnopilus junonius TaxID=109634 RepID=A0A9P5TPF3_GYMJU|nr:hypothetical protein CPB84DRAFT_1777276 [Gymnopilus junonius]